MVLGPLGPEIRLAGAIGLLFFLPGWALLEAIFPRLANRSERIVLAVGLSYAASILVILYLIYLPGSISQGGVVGALNVWVVLFLALAARRRSTPRPWQTSQKVWLALAILFGVTLALRLPLLGYSEFHEDEIEVTSLAARVLGGADYAIFLHRKGPAQTLIPLMTWLNTGRVTEFVSRFPFALAGALGVMAVYVLTRRLADFPAAVLAALLLAVNGFSIGFGRLVQYQALLLLLGPLAIWAFRQAYLEQDYRWLAVGSGLFAVCTLAHYDALLYGPVLVYLVWLAFKETPKKRQFFKWLMLSGLLYLLIVASFYVPYMRDPEFSHTLTYLTDSRIGDQYLYNNLAGLQETDQTYNSRFYLPLLWVLTIALVAKWAKSTVSRVGLLICLLLLASTYWLADLWQMGFWDLAVVPWLLFLGLGWFYFGPANEGSRVAWVWWLTALIGYVFLVDKPGTHFYIAYPAWAVVAGLGFGQIWRTLKTRWPGWGQAALVFGGGATVATLFYYQTLLFWHTGSTYQRYLEAWDQHPWHQVYQSLPDQYSYFGSPRRLGWKTVGWLLANGVLHGDYRSANEVFSVPIWYTYQTPRSCFNDPQNYFVAYPLEDLPDDIQNYTHIGDVLLEGRPRIAIFTRGAGSPTVTDYHGADYIPRFDTQATLRRFADPPPLQYPAQWRFGEVANFLGFSLSSLESSPGETLEVTLRWQSLTPVDVRYRAFVHLEKGQMWGQHDDDPACRLPTNLWRAGQIAEGQFRVTVDPATPAGDYPLTVGLYDPANGGRLPIYDAQNNQVGDSLVLATIQIN